MVPLKLVDGADSWAETATAMIEGRRSKVRARLVLERGKKYNAVLRIDRMNMKTIFNSLILLWLWLCLCLGLCALLSVSGLGQQTPARRKIIIDQDAAGPAGTDQQSMLLLIQSPQT